MWIRLIFYIFLSSFFSSSTACPIPFDIQSKCRCAITETGRVYIYCARKQLTVIPRFNSSNIIFDELVLSGNRISIVHKNAFTGLKLRKLEFQSNPINSIESQAFVDLANYLEELILSTTLTTSKLNGQTLMQILIELPNLKRLSLRSFDLSTSDSSNIFSNGLILRKLTQLSLQSCSIGEIRSIENFIKMFPNLERLDLSENRLDTFDFQTISLLKKLKVLNLSKNKIQHFQSPASIDWIPSNSLLELDLSYNGIESVDEHIFELISSQLEILNLRNNELNTEKDLLFLIHLNNLREFYLDYNRLESINQVNFPLNLKVLSLKNNRLTHLDLSILTRLGQMEKFYISSNKLTQILWTNKHILPSLEIFELDRNQLSYLPTLNAPKLKHLNLDGNFFGKRLDSKIFIKVPQLERLHLRDNQIESIDSYAFQNTRLQSLDLRNNSLQSIPNFSKINETLQSLSLRRNQICTIEKSAFRFYGNLLNLELDQNPLHCDCRMNKNFHSVKVSGQCESPPERRNVNLNELPDEPFPCSILTMGQCHYLAKTISEYQEENLTTSTVKTTTAIILEKHIDPIEQRETTVTHKFIYDIIRISDLSIKSPVDQSQLWIEWQLYPSTIDDIVDENERRAELKLHDINGFKISSTFPKYQMSELIDVLQRNYTVGYIQHGEICLYLIRTNKYEKFCKQIHSNSKETMKSSLLIDSNPITSWYNNEPTKSILIGSMLGILLVLILLTCAVLILARCPSLCFCQWRSPKYHQNNDSKSESLLVRPTPTNTIPWTNQSMKFYSQPTTHSFRTGTYQTSSSTQCSCPSHYHSSGSSSTGTVPPNCCSQGQNYHIYQEIPNEECHVQTLGHQYRTYRPMKVESTSSPSSLLTQTTTNSEQCQHCSLSVLV